MNFLFASFETVTGFPDIFGYIFTFIFGAIVGSFLNVVIHRVPNEESIVFPNSACPKCKSAIKAYDNLPILSWLILGGKCRNCKEKIAWRYPAVELLTAILFVLTFWAIGFTAFLPVCLIFVATMISLIFIDAENMILPNVINFPLLGLALLVRILYPIFFSPQEVWKYFPDLTHSPLTLLQGQPVWLISLSGAVLGGLVGGGFLWLVGEAWKRSARRGRDGFGRCQNDVCRRRTFGLAFDASVHFSRRIFRRNYRCFPRFAAKGKRYADADSVRNFSRYRRNHRVAFR